MKSSVFLALGLLLAVVAGVAQAQTFPPPTQSLKPTPSACGPGSQSVRVCGDDFRSCNSFCTARALDVTADIAGCSLRCCTQFRACLSIRGCASRAIDCF